MLYYKNYDIIAGSILMCRNGTTDTDKLIVSPVWDLDNALGRVNVYPHSGVPRAMQLSAEGRYIDNVGAELYNGTKAYVCFMQELGRRKTGKPPLVCIYCHSLFFGGAQTAQ